MMSEVPAGQVCLSACKTVQQHHLLKTQFACKAESRSGSALCAGILAFAVLATPAYTCRQAGVHVCSTRHLQGSFHTKHGMFCAESHAAHLAGTSMRLSSEL